MTETIELPHNAAVEKDLLASFLAVPDQRPEIIEQINPADMYITAHQLILKRCFELYRAGDPVDAGIIGTGLTEEHRRFYNEALIFELLAWPPAVDAAYSARILKNLRARRQAIELSNAITKAAIRPDIDLDKIGGLAHEIVEGVGAATRGNSNPWAEAVLDFGDFIEMDLPERKILADPWLWEQSITLVSAWRGVGKTFFGLGLVDAITKGKCFGPWKTGAPVGCLYLDGEMPTGMLQERAREMGIGKNTVAPAQLVSINVALDMGLPRSNLLDAKFRSYLKDILLRGAFKFFVVDNISSLMPEVEENAKESFDPITQWALDLRFCGVSTLFLHHVSKAGSQRGHSGREDQVDTSILLRHPENYHPSEGCRFVVSFSKDRVSTGNRALLQEYEMTYQGGDWTFASLRQKSRSIVLKLIDQGLPQKQIALEVGLTAGRVSQIRREATEGGLLTKEGKLTQSGFCELSQNS